MFPDPTRTGQTTRINGQQFRVTEARMDGDQRKTGLPQDVCEDREKSLVLSTATKLAGRSFIFNGKEPLNLLFAGSVQQNPRGSAEMINNLWFEDFQLCRLLIYLRIQQWKKLPCVTHEFLGQEEKLLAKSATSLHNIFRISKASSST